MFDIESRLFQPNLFAFSVFSIGFCLHLLGFASLLREKASKTSIALFSLTWVCGVWLMALGIALCMQAAELAEPWIRAAVVAISFIPPALWCFSVYITDTMDRHRLATVICFALSFYFGGVMLTDLVMTGLHHYEWGYYPKYSIYFLPFLAFLVWYMVRSVMLLREAHSKATLQNEKKRFRLLIVSFLISYLGIVDVLPAFGVNIYPVGYLAFSVYLCLMVFAVWHYRVSPINSTYTAEQILSVMQEALIVVDRKGVVRLMNTEAQKVYAKRALIRQGEDFDCLKFSGQDRVVSSSDLATTEGIKDVEGAVIAGGKELPVNISVSPLTNISHERAGSIILLRDITGKLALQDHLTSLSRAVEQSPSVIMIVDLSGRIEYVNEKTMQTTGHRRDELLNMNFLSLRRDPPADDKRVVIFETIRNGGDWREEVRLQKKDGEDFWVSESISPVRDPHGNIRHMIVIQEDISSRKRSDEELKEAYKLLKQTQMQLVEAAKFESVGRLSAGVAHEVKNPLAVVIMGLEVLENYVPEKDPMLTSVIDDIRKAVLRADHVVKGLLDFAAPKKARMVLGDPHQVINRALDMMRFDLQKAKIKLDRLYTEEPVKVEMDEAKLEQVFVNIFSNAIQVMPNGGLIRIQSAILNHRTQRNSSGRRLKDVFQNNKRFLAIWIEDSGEGISEAQLEKIFEPFYTTKKTGEGTGLGLSVSRSIVDLHGGSLEAENRSEGGACFTIHLPVKEE